MSDYDVALSAFQQNLPAGDEAGNQPEPNVPSTPATPPAETPEAPQEPESLLASSEVDLSSLTEEQQLYLRAREREMQAQMTRRTQEAVAQRQEAEQALQFIESLNSDPNFAAQVLNHLSSELAAAGYDFDNEVVGQVDEYGQPFGDDPYQQEIAKLQARQEQMEQYFTEQRLAADLEMQLAQISRDHPDWDETDQQAIIDLGYATGGDLIRAAEQYQAWQDNVLTRYLERKSSVNTPAPLPAGSGVAVPENLKSATDEELRAAAMEQIRASLG